MAFEFETELEFTRKVVENDWTMDLGDENPFDDISQEGKDFIHSLIEPNTRKRFSAKDALNHSWLKNMPTKTPDNIGLQDLVLEEKFEEISPARKVSITQ
jgi:serine/threonine protein kinase